MAYIGKQPSTKFSAAAKIDTFTGDGSTVAFDLANIVVEPSPVNVSFSCKARLNCAGSFPIYAICYPYTSSSTVTVASTEVAELAETFKISPVVPLFINTILFPDITSSEEPAGIVASLTMYTSLVPS